MRRQAASAAAAAVENSAAKRPYHITLYHTLSFPQSSNINLRSRFDSSQGCRGGREDICRGLAYVALRCEGVDYVPNESR